MTDPIFITGNARQGTTFIQWFLSLHPEIHVYGQELISWRKLITLHMDLANAGFESEKRNKEQKYPVPHWAGSDIGRTTEAFKELIYKYFSGSGPYKNKWGLKHLWIPGDVELAARMKMIYPNSKWIVCCRHPFISYESQKNTFIKDQDLTDWLRNWVMSVRFSKEKNSILVQVDKYSELPEEQRKSRMNQILSFLEEEPTNSTNQFVQEWPVVHKVVKTENRKYKLDQKIQDEKIRFFPGLKEYMNELGYM